MTRHGLSVAHSVTYKIWVGMRSRCSNPNAVQFKNYGARGICVCERWQQSFANFLADMGDKPAGKSLDRINNDGNYEPGNCRWATPAEQRRNQRNCVHIEFNGLRMTVEEWGRHIGIHPAVVRRRVNEGWKLEDIVSPVRQFRGRNSPPREYANRKKG